MKTRLQTAGLLGLSIAHACMLAAGAQDMQKNPQDGYGLVWADEFNKDGSPDPANWTFEHGFVRNEELQWYQPENAFCENGLLVIEGRRERKPNPNFRAESTEWRENRPFADYTSACLITKGLHAWQYGRFEVRARFKTHNGLWPAIWFLGAEGEWPSNGEVDLMEFYKEQIWANACWGTKERWKAEWDGHSRPIGSFGDYRWDEKFHVWRMDWDRDSIRLFLDDVLLNAIDVTKTINPTDKGPENPFRQPLYILLNLAIGAGGGNPANTAFPTRYEINYVRVYQKPADNPAEDRVVKDWAASITIPGDDINPGSAHLLLDPGKKPIPVTRDGHMLTLQLPMPKPTEPFSVVALERR